MKTSLKIILFIFLPYLNCTSEIWCKHIFEAETKSNWTQFERLAERFSDLVFHLSKKYFANKDVINVLITKRRDNDAMLFIMEKTLQKLNLWTIIANDTYCCESNEKLILSYNKVIRTYKVPQMYIIPIHKSGKIGYLRGQLVRFKTDTLFNPRALFILVKLTDQCGGIDDNFIQNADIFNIMWRHNLFATTLFILSVCDYHVSVVSARPFSEENTCRKVKVNGIKYLRFSGESNINISLLYDEPINLQGCTFWIGTTPIPPFVVGEPVMIKNKLHYKYVDGIDIQLMQMLTARINFTYKFARTHSYGVDAWFARAPNGTVIGIVQDLIDQNIDIAFGGVMPSYVTYYRLDYSLTYKFTSVSWYVTDPDFIPGWKIIFIAFPMTVWIFSAVVFIVVTVLYYMMESYIYGNRFYRGLEQVNFKEFFSLNLGMSSMLNPSSASLRVLLCVWAIYSLHWTTDYTSILFTLLTNPPLEKEILTIQDLKRSKLKTGLDELYLEYFGHIKIDKITKAVFDNHFICPSLENCLQQFIKFRNFSVMDKDLSVEYLVNLQKSRIHKLSDKMVNYFVSIITNKGNSLSTELNKLLFLSFQSGLLQKWENDVNLYYRNITNTAVPSGEKKIPLGIPDLGGAFFILFTGLIFSFIVFLGELLSYRRQRKTANNGLIINVREKHCTTKSQ